MKRYSAAIILLGLWLAFWALHAYFAWRHALNDAVTHMQPFEAREFWVEFFKDTFENNQSEVLQIMIAAWVFKHFLWTGTPESKDTDA